MTTYPQWLDELIDEFPPVNGRGEAVYSLSRVQRLHRLFADEDDATMQAAVDAYLNGKTYGFPRAGDLKPHVEATKKTTEQHYKSTTQFAARQCHNLAQRTNVLLEAAYAGGIDDGQWQQLGRDLEASGATHMLNRLRRKYRQLTAVDPAAPTAQENSRNLASYRQRLGLSPTAVNQTLEAIPA